jgi:amino acid adenylation domain-containing protein
VDASLFTVHEAFELAAAEWPLEAAIVCGERRLTYRELDSRASALAHVLCAHGVARDTVVGVMVRRSPEMLVSILAVLKAGGAYLPLDPTYPLSRLEYMLEHSRAGVLVTHPEALQLSGMVPPVAVINPFEEGLARGATTRPRPANEPGDMIYVIYTSGSTGRPKGVVIEHRSVLNVMSALAERLGFVRGKRVLSLSTLAFDVSVFETLLPLVRGMTVVIATEEEQRDLMLLKRRIMDGDIQILQLTPSRLGLLLEEPGGLEAIGRLDQLLVAGEAFPEALFARLRGCPCEVFNLYGPTETTIYSLYKKLEHGKEVTIGQPVANTQLYIVDEANRLVETGQEGELLIGGAGLARGYFAAPELTAQRFIDNPVRPGERVYRTGDLVRAAADGDIQYLGRIDRQIKLRGYRVELEEIERRLLEHEQVAAVTVEAWDAPQQGKRLCAYVVLRDPASPLEELRAHLQRILPDYMVPASFVRLDALPLTPNGKVDRKALPPPSLKLSAQVVPPSDVLEQRLAALWGELLDIPPGSVGLEQDFFELGGNSLSAALLLARVEQQLGVRLPMALFFGNTKLRRLAEKVRLAAPTPRASLRPALPQEYYPLSAEQSRLFILYQMEPGTLSYNITEAYRVEGLPDRQRIREAFERLIARHESLRTSIVTVDGTPLQRIHQEFSLELTERSAPERDMDGLIDAFIRPFDLSRVPLMRIGLLSAEDSGSSFFLIDFHHIACDGLSRDILARDFVRLYLGEELPPLPLQYKDYALWQREHQSSQELRRQEEFWVRMFEGRLPVLELPVDREHPAVRRLQGADVTFRLGAEAAAGLKELGRAENATMFMVLLAASYAFLARLTSQEDIVIGTPIAGRHRAEFEHVAGMFVNTLALRARPARGKSFRGFLREVRDMVLQVFENQEYQLDQLVNRLRAPRYPGRNILFDVMFILQDTETKSFSIPGLRLTPHPIRTRSSKVDLTIHMREYAEHIEGRLEYDSDLFERATVELMRDRLVSLLTHLPGSAEVGIEELDDSTEDERMLRRYDEVKFDFS